MKATAEWKNSQEACVQPMSLNSRSLAVKIKSFPPDIPGIVNCKEKRPGNPYDCLQEGNSERSMNLILTHLMVPSQAEC